MTIYEDAFLSLTDFQDSPADILFFPKSDIDPERKRVAEVWKRGDYDLLSKSELDTYLEIFVVAREEARSVLLAEIEHLREKAGQDSVTDEDLHEENPDLFTKK